MQISSRWLLLFLALAPCCCLPVSADDKAYPKVDAFAAKITDVVWKLRGTNSLKGLRFDGEQMWQVRTDGRSPNPYETAVVDPGVVRIQFSDETSGWYLISDDLKFVTSLKVLSERTFALAEGTEPKPVARFPQDVENVVYSSTDDGPDRLPGKIRWNGKELEFAALHGSEWKTERHKPFVANRRAFEVRASEEVVIWFLFSEDGSELWFLQIESIFGGHREDLPARSDVTPAESGLSAQDNDLANHMIDLVDAGVKEPTWTLQRQFERKHAKSPDLLEALKKRVNGR
jgi:hypothetical protein